MFSIVANFNSLIEYLEYIACYGSKGLCPSRCGHCGKASMCNHGYYPRKADRENCGQDNLNPIPIFRFYCQNCGHTCSVLPMCIAPRRWYLWAIQQVALALMILEQSYRSIATQMVPGRSTIKRWRLRFEEMFLVHALHLRSRFPELGRNNDCPFSFWKICLEQMSLSKAMYWVHHAGGKIP